MKIKFTFILAVLLFGLTTFAMSNDAPNDLTINEELVKLAKENPHRITEEELHNIAVNYYHYEFEEEHEWKGIRVDSSKSVIKDIFPYEEDGITFFYTINFNPDGHIVVPAYDFIFSPGAISGSGIVKKINSINSKKIPIPAKRIYHKIKKAVLNQDNGNNKTNEKEKALWNKLNVPPDKFHEKRSYESNSYQPDWWLEKKKFKNTQGMIKTEWHLD